MRPRCSINISAALAPRGTRSIPFSKLRCLSGLEGPTSRGGLAQRESIGFASQGSRVRSPHPPLSENRIVERSTKHGQSVQHCHRPRETAFGANDRATSSGIFIIRSFATLTRRGVEENDIPRDGEQRLRCDGLGTLPVRIELVELDEKRLMVVKLVRAFGGCLGTKRR